MSAGEKQTNCLVPETKQFKCLLETSCPRTIASLDALVSLPLELNPVVLCTLRQSRMSETRLFVKALLLSWGIPARWCKRPIYRISSL
jgi:hypothetical protein